MSLPTSSATTSEGQPQVCADELIPEASTAALNFLESLVPDVDFKYLMFDDHLATISDNGKELGEFSVNIELTRYNGEQCFLVHANSHGAIDGVPCGTSITACIGSHLETIEQQHHEYVKLENCPLDRKTSIVKQENDYIINRVIIQGEDIQRSSKTVNIPSMNGFVSEGSNLLLHRLLIEKGIPDNLQMISFDSDINLCPAIYRKLEDRIQTIDRTELKVFGIERTINSSVDLPTTWQSYFLQDGHLTHRVQVGSPITMKLMYIPMLIIRDEEPPKPTFEKQSITWEDDEQQCSLFLGRKEELKADHTRYMKQHPELQTLLADFMQFLLLQKPDDVIAFAAEYFAAFSTSMPSSPPYLNSNCVTPFPNSRTNSRIDKLRAPTR